MKAGSLLVVFGILLTWAALIPPASADELTQLTRVTFDRTVEIPGAVLPAGSYWFVLAEPDAGFPIVRVFSLDWKTLYASDSTLQVEHLQLADSTTFTFAERKSKPDALLSWFYPGETIGHQFVYHRREETELTRDRQQTIDMADQTHHAS